MYNTAACKKFKNVNLGARDLRSEYAAWQELKKQKQQQQQKQAIARNEIVIPPQNEEAVNANIPEPIKPIVPPQTPVTPSPPPPPAITSQPTPVTKLPSLKLWGDERLF